MMPEEIYGAFLNRINKTNMLFNLLNENSPIEMVNSIYFKYYFDISTTIEATIRGIAFEESKQHTYIEYSSAANSETKAYFVQYDELKALISDVKNLYEDIDKCIFEEKFYKKINILNKYKITKKFTNDGSFKNDYESVRKTRNILAHGLLGGINSVDYTKAQLEKFLYVLYLLFNYYDIITKA